MNFEQGTRLAERQDKILNRLKFNEPVSKNDKKIINKNLWVRVAEKTAPSNLVVRHYCIQDIINNNQNKLKKIKRLISLLAPENLWAEGYSYWRYTKTALLLYAIKYKNQFIRRKINDIDEMFILTGYLSKSGLRYPAPFGDLRDEPLEFGPKCKMELFINMKLLKKDNNIYRLKPFSLGLNTHAEVKEKVIEIVNGVPMLNINGTYKPFNFYEGYSNKYSNKLSEIKDTFLNPKRWSLGSL